MNHFLILGLPRSRTYWLSRYLSYGGWYCGHDEVLRLRSLDDITSWFAQPNTGSSETAAAPFWRLALAACPDLRIVTVRRPVEEVVASLQSRGFGDLTPQMRYLNAKLDQIEQRVDGVVRVHYEDLVNEATCAKIFEHCLPYKHDSEWWQALNTLNLQIDLGAQCRYAVAHAPQIEKLTKIARAAMLSRLKPPLTRVYDGVEIQQEPLAVAMRDGQHISEAHCLAVGEAPDHWQEKNIPLMEELERMGCLMVTTARCNGRMFGYVVSLITPSMEDPDLTSGVQTLFYASPAMPGLGMRLQRASIAALKDRGCGEVVLRAGVRGAGKRVSAMCRRLGGEDFGQLYRIDTNTINPLHKG